MALVGIEELDRDTSSEQIAAYVLSERQCRMTLAADWPRIVPLAWNPGKVGKPSVIPLHPGKSVVQPLGKAQCWFGPFAAYVDMRTTTDEKQKQLLRDRFKAERERYLNLYDYPRGDGRGARPIMTPSGPHRSPDVTVTILNADGTECEPIRLYELYKIGEFDPLKDTFLVKETPEEIEARYQAELAAVNERYEREVSDFRMQLAELRGEIRAGGKVASDGPPVELARTIVIGDKLYKINKSGMPYDPETGRILPRDQWPEGFNG